MKSTQRLFASAQLIASVAIAPLSVQRLPGRLRRSPTMCRHELSTTPEPICMPRFRQLS